MKQTDIRKRVADLGGHISMGQLSDIFAGKARMSWRKAKKLAEATDTDPALWLDGSPEEIKRAIRQAEGRSWDKGC